MSDESTTPRMAATQFCRSENRFQLARLCGLPVGRQGEDSGPVPAQGMALLSVDGRRYESGDLTLEAVEESDAGAQCRWRVGDTSLYLTAVWQICPTTGIVSRRDTLTNHGDEPAVLTRCLARVAFPPGRYECYTQASRWCHENQGAWQPLHTGWRLSHLSGRTTEGSTPYLALRAAGAERGIAFHLLPRGNWTIRVSPAPEGGELPFAVVELGWPTRTCASCWRPARPLSCRKSCFSRCRKASRTWPPPRCTASCSNNDSRCQTRGAGRVQHLVRPVRDSRRAAAARAAGRRERYRLRGVRHRRRLVRRRRAELVGTGRRLAREDRGRFPRPHARLRRRGARRRSRLRPLDGAGTHRPGGARPRRAPGVVRPGRQRRPHRPEPAGGLCLAARRDRPPGRDLSPGLDEDRLQLRPGCRRLGRGTRRLHRRLAPAARRRPRRLSAHVLRGLRQRGDAQRPGDGAPFRRPFPE